MALPSLKVGAATESELKEIKHRVEDALQATRAAVEEGWDVDTLEEHIHAIEHVLYPEVVQMLADGRVHVLENGKVAIDAPRG